MIYNVFMDIGMLIFISACVVVGYKVAKPYIRVEAYKAGYYVGRLRQHAEKHKVDLDMEVVNVLRSDLKLMKTLSPDDKVKNYIEQTDALFDENKK